MKLLNIKRSKSIKHFVIGSSTGMLLMTIIDNQAHVFIRTALKFDKEIWNDIYYNVILINSFNTCLKMMWHDNPKSILIFLHYKILCLKFQERQRYGSDYIIKLANSIRLHTLLLDCNVSIKQQKSREMLLLCCTFAQTFANSSYKCMISQYFNL